MGAVSWVTGTVLVGAFLSRSVWVSDAPFHPDESTVLWIALDAVRDTVIPDHGLISSYRVYQPPGLVWVTMPFVAVGGGRPELVIVGFAMLNAAAIALLVATVARAWGLLYAAVLGLFLIVGPDAWFSALVWHPSLYTAAMCLVLTAGIRLPIGSRWWAAVLVAHAAYALIHYSGVILFAPALALIMLSRRAWKQLVTPAVAAVGVVVCAWAPFLAFEAGRDWVDLQDDPGRGGQRGIAVAKDRWALQRPRLCGHPSRGRGPRPRRLDVGPLPACRSGRRDRGGPTAMAGYGLPAARSGRRDRRARAGHCQPGRAPGHLDAVACAPVCARGLGNRAGSEHAADILGRRAVSIAVVVLVAVVGSVDLVRAVHATQRTSDSVSSGTRRGRVRRSRTSLESTPWSRPTRSISPATRRMTGDQRCGTSARSLTAGAASATPPRRRVPLEGGPRLVRGTGREASPESPGTIVPQASQAIRIRSILIRRTRTEITKVTHVRSPRSFWSSRQNPDGSDQTFEFTGDLGKDVEPGSYSTRELVPNGWIWSRSRAKTRRATRQVISGYRLQRSTLRSERQSRARSPTRSAASARSSRL